MTHYVVTGAGGMLGAELLRALHDREVTTLGRSDLDITDADAVRDAVVGHDVVINAAAYTNVSESHASSPRRGTSHARTRCSESSSSCTSGWCAAT